MFFLIQFTKKKNSKLFSFFKKTFLSPKGRQRSSNHLKAMKPTVKAVDFYKTVNCRPLSRQRQTISTILGKHVKVLINSLIYLKWTIKLTHFANIVHCACYCCRVVFLPSLTARSSCTINLLLSSSTSGCPSMAVLRISLQRSSRSLTSFFDDTRTLKSCAVSSRSLSSIFTAKYSSGYTGSDVDFLVRLQKPSVTESLDVPDTLKAIVRRGSPLKWSGS